MSKSAAVFFPRVLKQTLLQIIPVEYFGYCISRSVAIIPDHNKISAFKGLGE